MNSYIIRSDKKLAKSKYQSICSLLLDRLKECYEQTVILDCKTGREWTGEQVYESALNLAYYLISECLLKPEDIVCIVAPDSDIHAIAVLGVIAAGGVYCSLPSHSTYREIDEALTRIEPSFLVTDWHSYGICATIATEMLSIKKLLLIDEKSARDMNKNLDIIENLMQYERSFLPLPIERALDDIGALIITSASDGSTKSVIKTNRNLIAATNALNNSDNTNNTADNEVVLISGLYCGSGLNMFLHVINSGSTVAIFENDRSNDNFINYLQKYSITTTLMTNSQLYRCIEDKDVLKSLTNVWFISTTLAEDIHLKAIYLFKKFRKIFSNPEAGWVTAQEYSSKSKSQPNLKTIGRPVAGVELKVVDSNGQSLPMTTVGEICCRSHQCAPGYQNNECESAQVLMADQFIRTGEYGYYDSDGLFYSVGHSEEFIKVDDFMISAEELESILLMRIDVKAAAVVCAEDQTGDEFPKALVTLKRDYQNQNKELSEESLREFVNLRVDRRKGLRSEGIEVMKESPHLSMRRFSFKQHVEKFV